MLAASEMLQFAFATVIRASIILATTALAVSGAEPVKTCFACKLNAAAKQYRCILRAAVKEAKQDKSAFEKIFVDCDAALAEAFAKCEAAAQKNGGQCPTNGDASVISSRVVTDARELAFALGAPSRCCSKIVMLPDGSFLATCYDEPFGVTQDFCDGMAGTFLPQGVCNAVPVCEPTP